jgi:hypothetical protein
VQVFAHLKAWNRNSLASYTMPKWIKSGLLWTALAVFAFAVAGVGLQLATHGHTGIRRVLSGALHAIRSVPRSQDTEAALTTATVSGLPHSVTLTWKASPSSGARYGVYRRGVKGPAIRVNGAPVTDTSYTDDSVQPGQTYFYTIQAISLTGSESSPSNEVRVDVPSP